METWVFNGVYPSIYIRSQKSNGSTSRKLCLKMMYTPPSGPMAMSTRTNDD